MLGREIYPDAVLYYSRDSHYSVPKAARLFQIPHVVINSQPCGEIDYKHLEQELSLRRSRPSIININLGTTMNGAVDKIEPIVSILENLEMDFHLHCDGALGGMLLPFLEEAPKISFIDYPIGSIAISGHKFIGCPIPCGVVLTYQEYVDKVSQNIEIIGSNDTTILGSRSGFTPLAIWYAIQTRGDKFADEASTCLRNAHYLRDRLTEIGYHPLLNNFSTTVVFEKPSQEVCYKWQLATEKELAHVVVMQHVTQEKIDELIDDLLKE